MARSPRRWSRIFPAAGRDSTTLAREIEQALGKYIRDPVVTVIVGASSGLTPADPGDRRGCQAADLPYRQKMTVLDVMIGGRRYHRFRRR